jgi:hypothetical protein
MLPASKTVFAMYMMIGVATFAFVPGANGQVLTNTSDGTLSASIPFGSLTPGKTTAVSSSQIQFRIRDNSNSGYHVTASAVFSASTLAAAAGGSTIAASDIGIGITSLVDGSSVLTPRTDTINSGFNYNPATVGAPNGTTPYTGMSSGMATLQDIISNPVTVLSGPRIASSQNLNTANNAITVTITIGILGQFFTPATFSGTLTLTIANGP